MCQEPSCSSPRRSWPNWNGQKKVQILVYMAELLPHIRYFIDNVHCKYIKIQWTVVFWPSLTIWPQVLQQWHSLDESSRSKYIRKSSRCPEPTLSLFRPDVCFGSVSENFRHITDKYLEGRGSLREDSLDAHRFFLTFFALQSSWAVTFTLCFIFPKPFLSQSFFTELTFASSMYGIWHWQIESKGAFHTQ